MSIQIQAVSCTADKRYLDKAPFYVKNADETIYGATYNGYLVASEGKPCDMLHPVFDISDTGAVPLASLNYCYIPLWQRYYYMKPYAIGSFKDSNDVVHLKYRVQMDIDVRMSWKGPLGECPALITRQENALAGFKTEYEQDIPLENGTTVTYTDIGDLGSNHAYFLTVGGGVSTT